MSHEITTEILNFSSRSRQVKLARTGWYTFNAVCCHHRGEKPDAKKRGGWNITADSGLAYSCFNCGYTAQWHPGQQFNNSFKSLLGWFGMPSDEIKKLNFAAWRQRDVMTSSFELNPLNKMKYDTVALPKGAQPFSYWLENDCTDTNFFDVIQYVYGRGIDIYDGYDYYWTPDTTQKNNRSVIIPFYWKNEIVGFSKRNLDGGKVRYINNSPADYIFNTDRIRRDDKYIFIVEGPFDAIAINACATLGDHISSSQKQYFSALPQQKIIVADREKGGGKLVDVALEMGWAVSMAPKSLWGEGVKDSADLVKKYGKLYAIRSIIDNIVESKFKIQALRKLTFG